jgi:hypothetical protein
LEKNKGALVRQLELRQWVQDNLPIENSLVGFDLLMEIAKHKILGNPQQTVKQLFGSLPQYSYTAIRSHYLRLLKLKLIILIHDSKDKRVKYVQASESLTNLLNTFLEKSIQ